MPWLILIILVGGLAAFLWTWVKNYERESAEAAHERIQGLEIQITELTTRVQNLEAINTEISGTFNVDAEPRITRSRTRS